MFHPETQTVQVHGRDRKALTGKLNNEETDAIMYSFSQFMHTEALKNLKDGFHKFNSVEEANKVLYLN